MIIRTYGHATTETLLAAPWKEFLKRPVASVSLAAPSAKSEWRNKWIFNVTHACFGPGASSD